MMVTQPSSNPAGSSFSFVGGALALDFVNTASARGEGPLKEKLLGYDDLVRFASEAGVVDAAAAKALLELADRSPDVAEKVLATARDFREAIYRAFSAHSQALVTPRDLLMISQHYTDAIGRRTLVPTGSGFRFEWPTP